MYILVFRKFELKSNLNFQVVITHRGQIYFITLKKTKNERKKPPGLIKFWS